MAWTTPKTWSAGEALTADLMNEQLRDNMVALFDPVANSYLANEVADYTVSNTSFEEVDDTNFNFTIACTGRHVLVGFTGTLKSSAINAYTYFDIEVDGVRLGLDDGLINQRHASTSNRDTVCLLHLTSRLSVGDRVIKLLWKVSAGTTILYAGAATASNDVHPQFFVHEL